MKYLFLLLAAMLPLTLQAKPTPDEVKRVVDYYNNGQDEGVVLADIKLCESIGTEGEAKNECQNELDASTMTVGQPVMVWMNFMVPVGMKEQEIMLQFNYQGVTRDVQKATVSNAMRYRVWRKVKFDRAGDWTATITHDNGQSTEVLREMKFRVQPK